MNQLFYGDNLPILRQRIKDESVDLVYLDPPFNSKRSYNVLFESKSSDDPSAQIEAFGDTWHWSQESDALFDEIIGGGAPPAVADAVLAMQKLLGKNDVLAYLVMMSARLVELHRVLKPTGSLFLHCDPTASHYLKIVLDAIFDVRNFRNEIVWHYFNKMQGNVKRLASDHDIIFWYSKSATFTFHPVMELRVDGPKKMLKRRWDAETKKLVNDKDENGKVQYIERTHKLADDVWRMPMLQPASKEKLDYPTQKPLALLERILEMASNEGDLVLDPFCGCGTTVAAAQKLDRRWIGIDITYLAIDLIEKRLREMYGDDAHFEVSGVPGEVSAAQALFDENPFDFERWAVSLVNGQPNEKQVGDKGIDGVIRFHLNEGEIGEAVVSVKGGKQLNPAMVQSLAGAAAQRGAQMGVFVCLGTPTKGMIEAAAQSGSFEYEFSGASYPKVQIVTIAELLTGKRPNMPTPINPYKKAKKASGQMAMFEE